MSDFKKYYKNLNTNQQKCVDATDGPLLVLAGPGTGKTELLSVRAANIIEQKKALSENILILTYTNAASKAMKERLVKILGSSGYDIETGTFHSFANSIILESEDAANYIEERIQITDLEKVKLLEYILDHTDGIDAIRPFRAPYIYRRAIESKISELKKEGISTADFSKYINALKPDNIYVESKHLPRLKAFSKVYKLYEEYKLGKNSEVFDERGRYDFDDMIIYALKCLKQEKELKSTLLNQYKYIMVDEFQDTNGAQLNLLFELVNPKKPNLCCVGDDDQSIYRFQGASIGNFKLLKEKFTETKVVSLNDNYRSSKDIIGLSDKIISHLPERERMVLKELIPKNEYKDKSIEFHELSTEAEELIFLTEKIHKLKTLIESSTNLSPEEKQKPYNNIAVLVRKRADILKVIDAFLQAGIPYATDGKEDISGEKRVRQMLDVIMLAHTKNTSDFQDKDSLLYRILISDYFKIPHEDVLEFMRLVKHKRDKAREESDFYDITLFKEFISGFDLKKSDAPEKKDLSKIAILNEIKLKNPLALAHAAWTLMRLLQDSETRPVHAILLEYIKNAGIYKFILGEYADNSILRIRDLRAITSFVNMVKTSDLNKPALNIADFIDEIDTIKDHNMSLQGNLVTMTQDGVRIYTAHGSKGLEFHSVIIPFCIQDKNWPIKIRPDLIPLPPDIFKAKEKVDEKSKIKELNFYDETRLFYVASTRAKSNLIYSASPRPGKISSSYLPSVGLESAKSETEFSEEEILGKSLAVTPKKDPFIGTESILKDLVANLTLNPTSLNNYINCKRKFLYTDVLRLPSEKRLGLTFGNCVHKALEDTYRFFMQKKSFPDFKFFKDSFLSELNYQGVEKSIHLGCTRELETIEKWFLNAAKLPIKPIGLEKKLLVMIEDDLLFTGKYDKTELVSDTHKLVRVVDYKTGKPDDHIKKIDYGTTDLSSDACDGYLRQLVAYKLLFDRDKYQNKGFKVSEGMLVFVEPAKSTVIKYGLKKGEFINQTINITEKEVLELESVIKGVWKSIKQLQFDRLPEYSNEVMKCAGCDYKNICW